MTAGTRSSRDGIISLLVIAVALGGFWWWSSRQPDEGVASPSPSSSASTKPTTARPTSAKPSPNRRRRRRRRSRAAASPPRRSPSPASTYTYTPPSFTPVKAGSYAVRWVSDGDTFSIKDATGQELASVRIIGLNAPEVAHGASKAECYGPHAAAQLKKLLAGKTVKLVDDPRAPMLDRFGRRLAYVELGGQDVATTMIKGGYALEFHLPSAGPSVRTPTYEKAQAEAATAKRGLWGACPKRPDVSKT